MRFPLLLLLLLTACSGSKPAGGEPIPAFVSIQASDDDACGLAADGIAWCWGNPTGVLGNGLGGSTLIYAPEPALNGVRFASLSFGAKHSCGIGLDGVGYCWGLNGEGAIGTGRPANTTELTPAPVASGVTLTQVAAGEPLGQLGIGPGTDPFVGEPTRIAGPTGMTWRDVSAGFGHTCAIATDDTSWCWGFGEAGELGIGELPQHTPPYLAFRPVRVMHTRATE